MTGPKTEHACRPDIVTADRALVAALLELEVARRLLDREKSEPVIAFEKRCFLRAAEALGVATDVASAALNEPNKVTT